MADWPTCWSVSAERVGADERAGHRADQCHLEPVEDPGHSEGDDHAPVPRRPGQPIQPRRDVRVDQRRSVHESPPTVGPGGDAGTSAGAVVQRRCHTPDDGSALRGVHARRSCAAFQGSNTSGGTHMRIISWLAAGAAVLALGCASGSASSSSGTATARSPTIGDRGRGHDPELHHGVEWSAERLRARLRAAGPDSRVDGLEGLGQVPAQHPVQVSGHMITDTDGRRCSRRTRSPRRPATPRSISPPRAPPPEPAALVDRWLRHGWLGAADSGLETHRAHLAGQQPPPVRTVEARVSA